ncbi:hypothetical protein M378DRAFT_19495 [Amanita muscaria Koide BX008]|uniref:Uncharacterized protein n=1 Tax=Amanita muscaria (strain Koide BX008) TaxID=946122 RepID=A0A0C2WCS2_AMAMK|nr:hypothetical protein M378DRAFT_19495 [Amanita muscaria Koide BX008]
MDAYCKGLNSKQAASASAAKKYLSCNSSICSRYELSALVSLSPPSSTLGYS